MMSAAMGADFHFSSYPYSQPHPLPGHSYEARGSGSAQEVQSPPCGWLISYWPIGLPGASLYLQRLVP
jgi:hypothetical protein